MDRRLPSELTKAAIGVSSYGALTLAADYMRRYGRCDMGHDARLRVADQVVELHLEFTRARDLLVLEWPDFCKPDAHTVSNLLVNEGKMTLGNDAITVGKTTHPARVTSHGEVFPQASAPEPRIRPGRREVPGPRSARFFSTYLGWRRRGGSLVA